MKKTILLVEDNDILSIAEKENLEREGYAVIQAFTGEQAIDLVNKENSSIDLILMDINLGKGIDGIQAAQKILKTRDIPLIFLSSYTEKHIIELAERITSYGYVVKNSNKTALFASIRMAFKPPSKDFKKAKIIQV